MTPSTVRSLKQLAENMAADCGDNSCRFAKNKSGMRTNGGCRCVEIRDPSLRHFFYAANPEAVLGLIARIDELSARCAKLEAALQFYADPRTYEGGHNDDVGSTGIDIDYRGNTAREALTTSVDERGES